MERKNHLFADSDKGLSAYTIFGSCRMQGVNPLAWPTDVIGKLQAGWPRARLDEKPLTMLDAMLRDQRPWSPPLLAGPVEMA